MYVSRLFLITVSLATAFACTVTPGNGNNGNGGTTVNPVATTPDGLSVETWTVQITGINPYGDNVLIGAGCAGCGTDDGWQKSALLADYEGKTLTYDFRSFGPGIYRFAPATVNENLEIVKYLSLGALDMSPYMYVFNECDLVTGQIVQKENICVGFNDHGDAFPADCDGLYTAPAACEDATGTIYPDADKDGYTTLTDCDDAHANAYPGGSEGATADGLDNDCDGSVDEGLGGTTYVDVDKDGYTTVNDCDDKDVAIHPGATEVANGKDDDCDGSIDEGTSVDADGDGYTTATDCKDDDATIHPGATEIANSKDDDCDGSIDEGFSVDSDHDGYTTVNDCNDADAAINPGAAEINDNAVDENCDGVIGTTPTTASRKVCNTPGSAWVSSTETWKGYVLDDTAGDHTYWFEGKPLLTGTGTLQVCGTITVASGHVLKFNALDSSGYYSVAGCGTSTTGATYVSGTKCSYSSWTVDGVAVTGISSSSYDQTYTTP